ncbi:acetylornithine deacetylase [Methylocapsa sp. S129]|uniref:acetylornithine deacetylase n=1 Tax=Methylocapsa sp. S129 TaxID=1641869 RepID=UPI00131CB17C|nr:acetylornithine deacetylase [Methylocapsa sp. S129]
MSDDLKASAIALLERLAAFDTESDKSNLPLIDFVEDYLRAQDIPVLRAPNAAGDKAALLATIGPMVEGGIVLSGHTDVVPVEGQKWTSDPFTLRGASGRLYGRGSCDMKGFDAIALAMIPTFKAAGLRRPIQILLSYDEETTCEGSLDFIRRFGKDLPRPGAVIVGEPTMMEVADAHKSIATFRTTVTGQEAHSAKPALGANAVACACDIVTEIYREALAYEAPDRLNSRFDPPYSTLHVGTIHGGTARNILARECMFHWEFRGLPGASTMAPLRHIQSYIDSVALPRLTRFVAGPKVETIIEVDVPGLDAEPGSLAETLALKLTRSNRTNAVSYATEAGQFQRAGLPTVVCGPGSIDQAHKPDEFLEVSQVEACIGFMQRLAQEMAE